MNSSQRLCLEVLNDLLNEQLGVKLLIPNVKWANLTKIKGVESTSQNSKVRAIASSRIPTNLSETLRYHVAFLGTTQYAIEAATVIDEIEKALELGVNRIKGMNKENQALKEQKKKQNEWKNQDKQIAKKIEENRKAIEKNMKKEEEKRKQEKKEKKEKEREQLTKQLEK